MRFSQTIPYKIVQLSIYHSSTVTYLNWGPPLPMVYEQLEGGKHVSFSFTILAFNAVSDTLW